MYDINDDELTQLILDARESLDQTYRKTMYKQCLDIIVDWAVKFLYISVKTPLFSTQSVVISIQ